MGTNKHYINPYLFTCLTVLLVGMFKLYVLPPHALNSPLLLFLTAVTVSAWYGGAIQGFLATFLSFLFADYFLLPPMNFRWLDATYNYRLLLYLVDCSVITILCSSLRRYREKAEKVVKTEVSLSLSELRFKKVYDSNMIGLLFADTDGNIYEANDYFLKILGYSREDFSNNIINWREITPPSSYEVSQKAHEQLKKTGIITPFEKEYVRKDKSIVYVLVGASRMEDGRVVTFVLDISERKRVENDLADAYSKLEEMVAKRTQQLWQTTEEIRKSTEFLDSVIENIPNMIFVKDAKDLRFVRFNKAGERLLGFSRKELLGKNDYDLFPEEQAKFFTEKDREVLKRAQMVEIFDEPLQTKSGMRYLHTKKMPLFNQKGEPEYLLGISEDITMLKEAEQQKMILIQEQASGRAKSTFLANMSHEIRTPLGAMLGFADLLLDSKNLSEEDRSHMTTIIRNGKQLYKIVDEILDISKIESEAIEVENIDFSLQQILEEVRNLLDIQARNKHLDFKIIYSPLIPECVKSDPTKIRQILINIIGNAIKFTQTGFVHVDVQCTESKNSSKKVLSFLVKDSGIGIQPKQVIRLFQPFAQADSSMARKYGGTGLGLFISKKFARLLNGDLELVSSGPEGSVFSVHLEIEEVKNTEITISRPKKLLVDDEDKKPFLGNVLVVDDVEENRSLISHYVSRFGFNVECAAGGLEGVEKAKHGNFDLILMDLQMPDVDGFEAVHRLRQQKCTIPIVAVTAHAMKGDREMCLASGFDDYLCKPIDKELLKKSLLQFGTKK